MYKIIKEFYISDFQKLTSTFSYPNQILNKWDDPLNYFSVLFIIAKFKLVTLGVSFNEDIPSSSLNFSLRGGFYEFNEHYRDIKRFSMTFLAWFVAINKTSLALVPAAKQDNGKDIKWQLTTLAWLSHIILYPLALPFIESSWSVLFTFIDVPSFQVLAEVAILSLPADQRGNWDAHSLIPATKVNLSWQRNVNWFSSLLPCKSWNIRMECKDTDVGPRDRSLVSVLLMSGLISLVPTT